MQMRVAFTVLSTLFLCNPPAPGQPAVTDPADFPQVVARVDGREIGRAELLAQAEMMRLQAMQTGRPDPARDAGFYRVVLEALLGDTLVYLDSRSRGLGAGGADVDREVASMARSYGGEEALFEALADQGVDRASLRRQIEQSLTIDKVLFSEIAPTIRLSRERLRAYYDANRAQMRRPERYRVRHILLRVPAVTSAAQKEKTRSRLLAIRRQITEGADFAALARDHSEDPETRERGGELGWIAAASHDRPFERAVRELGIGELSEVVETEMGLHLIELLDYQPAQDRDFEEVEDQIRQLLTTLEIRREVLKRVEKLRADARIEILIP